MDDLLASSSSGSTPSIELQPSHTRLNAQCTPSSAIIVKRQPIPRKGHTKSRRGCFSCKKRKIKCQETKPQCENCQKAGILCEYPRSAVYSSFTSQSPAPQTVPFQSTPTIFSMKDLQLFHHFLVRAYPRLPVGASTVWTMEIPKFAHEVRNSTFIKGRS